MGHHRSVTEDIYDQGKHQDISNISKVLSLTESVSKTSKIKYIA